MTEPQNPKSEEKESIWDRDIGEFFENAGLIIYNNGSRVYGAVSEISSNAYNRSVNFISEYGRTIGRTSVKVAAFGLIGYVGIKGGSFIANYRLADLPNQNQVVSTVLKQVKGTEYGSVVQKNSTQTVFQKQKDGKFRKLDDLKDDELKTLAGSKEEIKKLEEERDKEVKAIKESYDSKVKDIRGSYEKLEEKANTLN
ncbi:Uncharacterised protein [uncultured archaeon]|nr:Uncharacterised protein [uncultured archaeon]